MEANVEFEITITGGFNLNKLLYENTYISIFWNSTIACSAWLKFLSYFCMQVLQNSCINESVTLIHYNWFSKMFGSHDKLTDRK